MSSVVDQGYYSWKDTTAIFEQTRHHIMLELHTSCKFIWSVTLSLVNSAKFAFHSYERPSHCLRVIVAVLNGFCYNNTMI